MYITNAGKFFLGFIFVFLIIGLIIENYNIKDDSQSIDSNEKFIDFENLFNYKINTENIQILNNIKSGIKSFQEKNTLDTQKDNKNQEFNNYSSGVILFNEKENNNQEINKSNSGINLFYDGCDTENIELENGQIWAGCDVGTKTNKKPGNQFTWGSLKGKNVDISLEDEIGTPGVYWGGDNNVGVCKNGYHIPDAIDFKIAINSLKEKNITLGEKLNLLGKNYWSSSVGYSQEYARSFNVESNDSDLWSAWKSRYYYIRCIKD